MLHLTYTSPRTLLSRGVLPCLVACLAALDGQAVLAQQEEEPPCGSLINGYGPYDYLLQKDKLPIVEQHHFTPSVAALSAGNTSVQIGCDLDYTLRAFPNHHRALLAMQRLQTPQPPGASVPVECYFERALRFRPHDITARLLYAKYLFQNRRDPQAQSQMQQVDAEPDADGMTHYNMGLIFLEQRHFLLAREQARKAYAMDVDAPALREQLLRQGWWP